MQADGIWGVTTLGNLIYVLRDRESEQIAVYDADSYRLQRKITVLGHCSTCGIVACPYYSCVYVPGDECVHRVALLDDQVTNWPVFDECGDLSVTDTHSVLVTCIKAGRIKEFSTDGKQLRQIQLSHDVLSPLHTIQLPSGQFIVCHDKVYGDADPCVSLIGSDGHVVKSYCGPVGSGIEKTALPARLAVDKNGFVFVADTNNGQVLLLSPTLTFVRVFLSHEQLKWMPRRLWLDSDGRRLYVAVNKLEDDECTEGKVVVVRVQ